MSPWLDSHTNATFINYTLIYSWAELMFVESFSFSRHILFLSLSLFLVLLLATNTYTYRFRYIQYIRSLTCNTFIERVHSIQWILSVSLYRCIEQYMYINGSCAHRLVIKPKYTSFSLCLSFFWSLFEVVNNILWNIARSTHIYLMCSFALQ